METPTAETETVPAQNPDTPSRSPGLNPVESGMFNYLERKSEKRIFYSYLHQFELTQEQLGPKVSRQLLAEIYRQASDISRRFDQPVATVSRNIISAAAWGTIYCLLGPTRMVEIQPNFRDIADEVELELMISHAGTAGENTIYRQLFSILGEQGLCHPEVVALIEACILSNREETEEYLQFSKAG